MYGRTMTRWRYGDGEPHGVACTGRLALQIGRERMHARSGRLARAQQRQSASTVALQLESGPAPLRPSRRGLAPGLAGGGRGREPPVARGCVVLRSPGPAAAYIHAPQRPIAEDKAQTEQQSDRALSVCRGVYVYV
jgi:hypothetical protein